MEKTHTDNSPKKGSLEKTRTDNHSKKGSLEKTDIDTNSPGKRPASDADESRQNVSTLEKGNKKTVDADFKKHFSTNIALKTENKPALSKTLGTSTSGKCITLENLAHLPNQERYQTKKMLGKGGMGVVMLVHDNILERQVAMKLMKNEKKQTSSYYRFIREARITGSLEHPNIISIYDLSSLDDLYFTMRLVQGTTFFELIQRLKKQDESYEEYTLSKRLRLFQNVCYALEYAHSKDIIHRDLKPENIMLGKYGEVFVLDWGLAKNIAEKKDSDSEGAKEVQKVENSESLDQTKKGSLIGTPRYMSPEQAKGRVHQIDKVTDIYALGAILYEVITLEPVFQAKDLISLIDKIVNSPVQKRMWNKNNEFIPKDLMAIALKAMAKKKVERYASVTDMRKDIDFFLEKKPVSAFQGSVFDKIEKFASRNSHIMVAAVLFMFFAAITYHLLDKHAQQAKADTNAYIQQQKYFLAEMRKQLTEAIYRHKELVANRQQKIDILRQDTSHTTQQEIELARILTQIEEVELRIETLGNDILNNYEDDYTKQELSRYYIESAKILLESANQQNFLKVRKKINRARQLAPAYSEEYDSIEHQISIYGKATLDNPRQIPVTIEKVLLKEGVAKVEFLQNIGSSQNLKLQIGSYLANTQEICFPFVVEPNKETRLQILQTQNQPNGMVFVPGGSFYFGAKRFADERQKQVEIKPFYIDSTEVTFKEYLKFYRAVGKSIHIPKVSFAGKQEELWDSALKLRFGLSQNCPVFGVTWQAANDFCEWKTEITGYRFDLPHVKEWEKSARGVDGRIFPWGNLENSRLANVAQGRSFGQVMPVGSFPADKSVYGVFDMAGNVAEWTRSKAANGEYFVKGSHVNRTIDEAKVYASYTLSENHIGFVGFRCVCRSIRIKNK